MYTHHIILIFNPICIFMFTFKRTLMPFKFFFGVFKTHIVNMIKSVLIKIRLNVFRCFLCNTYILIFMQEDFIHRTIKDNIILLLPVKFIYWYGIVTAFLSRYYFNILITKVSQYLALIWLFTGDMYDTGFWLTLRVVYISFSVLSSALTHHGVIMWRGIFYSLFTA